MTSLLQLVVIAASAASAPESTFGAACESELDCPGALCATDEPDSDLPSMCTWPCAHAPGDCPQDFECVDADTGNGAPEPVCMPRRLPRACQVAPGGAAGLGTGSCSLASLAFLLGLRLRARVRRERRPA